MDMISITLEWYLAAFRLSDWVKFIANFEIPQLNQFKDDPSYLLKYEFSTNNHTCVSVRVNIVIEQNNPTGKMDLDGGIFDIYCFINFQFIHL